MCSVNESVHELEKDASISNHRVVRKEKLASHMSEVCKKKIDAFQAKISRFQKTDERKKWNTHIFPSKRGRKRKTLGSSKKLLRIRQTFLKHNPSHRTPTFSSDPRTDEINDEASPISPNIDSMPMSDEDVQKMEEENFSLWVDIAKSDEDEWNSEDRDPLALPDAVEDPWKFVQAIIKDEPCDGISDTEDWHAKMNIKKKYCAYCGHCTRSLSNLRKHMRLRHMTYMPKYENFGFLTSRPDKRQYYGSCFHCTFSTRNSSVLKNHMLVYHKNTTPSLCSHCNYSTIFSHEFNLHLMSCVHSEQNKLQKIPPSENTNDDSYIPKRTGEMLECFKSELREFKKHSTYSQILKGNALAEKETFSQCNKDNIKYDFVPLEEKKLDALHNDKKSVVFGSNGSFSTVKLEEKANSPSNEDKHTFSSTQGPFKKVNLQEQKDHVNSEAQTVCKCFECVFNVSNGIQEHVENNNFQCTLCPFKTELRLHLEQHIIVFHMKQDSLSSVCLTCGYRGGEWQKVIDHIKNGHKSIYSSYPPRECPYCFYVSPHHNEYIKHLAKKHATKVPVKCIYCAFYATSHDKLAEHIRIEREKREQFFCFICHFSSNCSRKFKKHFFEGHENHLKKMRCLFCKYRTLKRKNLILHIKTNHSGLLNDPEQKELLLSIEAASSEILEKELLIEISSSSENDNSEIDEESASYPIELPKQKDTTSNCPSEDQIVTELNDMDPDANSLHFKKLSIPHNPMFVYHLICDRCFFVASNIGELHLHISKEHKGTRVTFSCDYSTMWYEDDNLNRYFKTGTKGEKYFHCPHCGFFSEELEEFRNHIKSKHENDKVFPCLHCPYFSLLLEDLENHSLSEHNLQIMFYCPHCHYKTKLYKEYEDHLKKHEKEHSKKHEKAASYVFPCNGESNNKAVGKPESQKLYKCFYCKYSTSNTQELATHVETNHKKFNMFFCYYCDYYCPFFSELEDHVRSNHETRKHLVCPHCCFSSWSRKKYLDHYSFEHAVEFNFNCTHCGFKTGNSIELHEHMFNVHQLDESIKQKIRFSCPHCDYTGYNGDELQEHITIDHATFKFFCSYCSYATDKQPNLQFHVSNVHKKGIHVCCCSLCNFITSDYSDLKQHMKLHKITRPSENEKQTEQNLPEIGDKAATRVETAAMQVNLPNSIPERPVVELIFACSDCEFSASSPDGLREHVLAYHSSNTVSSPPDKSSTPSADEDIQKDTPIVFCTCCDFGTDDAQELSQHYVTEHTEHNDSNENQQIMSSSKLQKTFLNPRYLKLMETGKLKEKIDSGHKTKSFSCSSAECKFQTMVWRELKEHVRTQHLQKCKPISSNAVKMKSIIVNRNKTVILPGKLLQNNCKINDKAIASGEAQTPMSKKLLPPTVKVVISGSKISFPSNNVSFQDTEKCHNVSSTSISNLTVNHKSVKSKNSQKLNSFEFSCLHCKFRTPNPQELKKHSLIFH